MYATTCRQKKLFRSCVGSVCQHAACDEYFRIAVVVEVVSPRSPRPAPERHVFTGTDVFKRAVVAIAEQGITHRVCSIGFGIRAGSGELVIVRNPLARVRPHVGDIEVRLAVVVVIEPGGAHARADVVGTSLRPRHRENGRRCCGRGSCGRNHSLHINRAIHRRCSRTRPVRN